MIKLYTINPFVTDLSQQKKDNWERNLAMRYNFDISRNEG